MKKAIILFVGLFLMTVTNAFSMNFDLDYWTPTDYTTAEDGSAFFKLEIEHASWESDFGIYTVDDVSNPTKVTDRFQIFDASEEPGLYSSKSVYFKEAEGTWYVSLDSTDFTKTFGNQFGFFFRVFQDGDDAEGVADRDFIWYTDNQFNAEYSSGSALPYDTNWDHIGIEYYGNENLFIFLDDQPSEYADLDWDDMIVSVHDLQPVQPVPEPASMLLLGTGLLGLAGVSRKKLQKK